MNEIDIVLSGAKVRNTSEGFVDDSKFLAFYLPQYHRIKENNIWWGAGFTEWTNVSKGRPNFEGHYQPQIPANLGFYDLTNVSSIKEQIELAKLYSVYGFCIYQYWFNGRRVLERPLDIIAELDEGIPFCICWANENWTRTWDGKENDVLLGQTYDDGFESEYIKDSLKYFKSKNYICIDGKPLLVIYRAMHFPDAKVAIENLKKAAIEHGLPGIHISVVDFYDIENPSDVNADSMVEFPPHKFNYPNNIPDVVPSFINKDFNGGVLDYKKIIKQSILKEDKNFMYHRAVMPGWDNTARRQDTSTIIINNTAGLFFTWAKYIRWNRRASKNPSTFIFINAWNEWGEGCHLEPCVKDGLSYLKALALSAFSTWDLDNPDVVKFTVINDVLGVAPDPNLTNLHKQIEVVRERKKMQPQSKLIAQVSNLLRRFPKIHRLAKSIYLKIVL